MPINNFNPYMQTQANNLAQQSTEPRRQNGFIPISGGEESALNYILDANSTVFFISGDTSEMFMRSVDSNGMTNMFRAFDIKEKMPKYQVNLMGDSLNDFATKEDMQKLTNEVKDLKKFLDELTSTSVKG
jgi:hypothetical protein